MYDELGNEQCTIETPEVPLQPPTVENFELSALPPTPSYPVSPSPRQGLTSRRRAKLGLGKGTVLIVLILIGCMAIPGCAGQKTSSSSGSAQQEEQSQESSDVQAVSERKDSQSGTKRSQDKQKKEATQPTAPIGKTITVGDVKWKVTDANRANQLEQTEFGQFGRTKQGNFVIVDFLFKNASDKPITLSRLSLALIDGQNRESQPDTDTFGYVPHELDPFIEQVNPGVTRRGRVIFSVGPDAANFQLQLGDANMFSNKNGYVDLGF